MLEFTTGAEPDKFRFKVDDDEFAVTLLDQMAAESIDELSDAILSAEDDQRALLVLNQRVKEIFDAEAPGVRSRLTVKQFNELAKAYLDASKVTSGE